MKTIKQFKNAENHIFASIFTEETQGLLMDVWSINYNQPKELNEVVEYQFSQILEQGLTCWLCDVNKLEEYVVAGGELSKQKLINLFSKSELKKIAFVCRKSQTQYRRQLLELLEQCRITVDTFTSNVSAMQWLLEEHNQPVSLWEKHSMLSF